MARRAHAAKDSLNASILSAERSAATREHMLNIAEAIFAERGIDSVSMRQLALEMGQANNSAIQYHFGGKAGLLREIIRRRVEAFEPRRQELLTQVKAAGKCGDPRTLFEVIYLPIVEAVDENGRHSYAALLLQFMTRSQYELGSPHPGWAADSAAAQAAILLLDLTPVVSKPQGERRIARISGFFLNALVERDMAVRHGRPDESQGLFLTELFSMMAAALCAPAAARNSN